jgi:DNA repair ATPase RecN
MSAVLTLLRIKNLALVEELEWQIGPGFVAITGETGAGNQSLLARCNFCWVSARTIADSHRSRSLARSKQFLAETICRN